MTELPKITKKQQVILKQLYRFRFLNRIQIQAEWIYSTHFAEKTKPAIYYLGLNGVRYLRTLIRESKDGDDEVTVVPVYPPQELRKRYKEPTRSQTYIDRCILVAGCRRPTLMDTER